MGTYLNPGKEEYEEAVRSEIFVDKSGDDFVSEFAC